MLGSSRSRHRPSRAWLGVLVGSAVLALTLPQFTTGGFDLIAQCWILDPAAPNGLASASAGTIAHAR